MEETEGEDSARAEEEKAEGGFGPGGGAVLDEEAEKERVDALFFRV